MQVTLTSQQYLKTGEVETVLSGLLPMIKQRSLSSSKGITTLKCLLLMGS
jgi:hypothetical protein